MISALIRKSRQLLADPVLRQWLFRRTLGLEKSPPAYTTGTPPYLTGMTDVPDGEAAWAADSGAYSFHPPDTPISIELPGATVSLEPDDPAALFHHSYADLESSLAAHRFAWVPLAGDGLDPDWVSALWVSWMENFGAAEGGWPWHAYTTAERAINIIDFSIRFAIPGKVDETTATLARHALKIRNNLEYGGEHNTSNHLSNNGRGLLPWRDHR